jgi:hypothetical protein
MKCKEIERMKKEKTIKVTFTKSDDMLYNNFIDILINSFLEEI